MNFSLTSEQQAMADSLRRFLADAGQPSWGALSELGVVSAFLPETSGGVGGAARDVALVFEELGRAGAASPALSCAMASACPGLTDDLLAGKIVAPALFEQAGRYDHRWCETCAQNDGGQLRVSGVKSTVPDADTAASFLVSAMLDGEQVVVHVPAGSAGLTLQCVDAMNGGKVGIVTLDAAAGSLIDINPDKLIAVGLLALGAEALGLMDAARDMTIDYMKQRKQFGKALAEFQVLQHRLADMSMAIEQVRSSVINAAAAFDQTGGRLTPELHALKYQTGEVGRLVAEEAIQLHGGIAMTQDYDLGRYVRRLIMLDHQLGDADWHLARFAEAEAGEAET